MQPAAYSTTLCTGQDAVFLCLMHQLHSRTSAHLRMVFPAQPCNPAVGGPAKSQLVHEVDALGGEIGKMADRCYLQKRVLNRSKVCTGPGKEAVHIFRSTAQHSTA